MHGIASSPVGGLVQPQRVQARLTRCNLRAQTSVRALAAAAAMHMTRYFARRLVLRVQQVDGSPLAEQPLAVWHVGYLHFVCVRGLQARYSAAVAAHALDEFVPFSTKKSKDR